MSAATLQAQIEVVRNLPGPLCSGRVLQVRGSVICSEGPLCSVGEECTILSSSGRSVKGEVVGFHGPLVLTMPITSTEGIKFGDRVLTRGVQPSVPVSDRLHGRILNALGDTIDGLASPPYLKKMLLHTPAPAALSRRAIKDPLGCGIRAIDAMLTTGRGQRIGIFGGSGVGKTTLIGMMARATAADLTILALVGERGREVIEFLDSLGDAGRQRSVVVVSTSDESAVLRIRASYTATALAEYFAAQGKNVLLVIDSLTRFAMAQREIGLAAGEPPTAKGYTPSVFSALAKLLERAGNFSAGSITGFYSVLMEGDDQQDPIVDAVRSLLDGHIVLDRKLARANHYPPISILDSLSRLMPAVCSSGHLAKAARIRQLLALHNRCDDLVRIGAYQAGTDQELDHAISVVPEIMRFLRQPADERAPMRDSIDALCCLPV